MEESTKILIVGMSSEKGGIEEYLIQFVRNVDKNKYKIDFLTFTPLCAYEEELLLHGCRVFHARRRGEDPLGSYSDRLKFFKTNADVYDFVWLHLTSASDISTIRLAKKHTKAKIACHSHGSDFESRGGLTRKVHSFLHKKNQKKLVENTDIYLACSKKAGQWLYGDIGDRLTLVPNGIKVSDFAFNLEKRIATRSRLRLEEGQVALGHVGRLAEVKNHKFLLGVFAAFRSKQPNSTLLLVGEGPLEEELKDECKFLGLESEVRFLGYREDVADLIQAFDVFVLPSFSEGFPITLVEAQACGLPCVVADNITQEVDITGLVSFVSLENSAERWAELIEERLAGDRASSEYITKLQNAGYTDEAATRIILKIFGGEI